MPLGPTTPDPGSAPSNVDVRVDPGAGRRARSARLAVAVVGGLLLVGGVAVVANRTPEAREVPETTEAVKLHGLPTGDLLRSSQRMAPTTAPPDPNGGTGTRAGDPAAGGTDRGGADRGGADRGDAPPDEARMPVRLPSGAGGTTGAEIVPRPAGTGPRGATGTPTASTTTTLPRPFYLPGGPAQAPVVGPIGAPVDDDHGPSDDGRDDHHLPDPPTPATEPHQPEPPDPDEEGCPNLNLYPIGGYAQAAPASFQELSPRFRALASAEWSSPTLVCGHPLEPWRDLVVQRLVAGGTSDGALVTAADGSSAVMRLSEIEWTAYRFRYGGGPIGTNLLGYPVERSAWGTATVLRTTAGGVVFAHPGAMGVPLIGGAWDRLLEEGGPDGRMGIPVGIPEAATGPIGAHVWAAGLPATGARQEFSRGWLFLPGVLSDVEAAAQPADRYEWHDSAELGPDHPGPIDYRGHIMQISGISYYVDREGIRHWIRTTSDWSCAHWDLRATEYEVRGHELAAYPLGDEFVCTDFKD